MLGTQKKARSHEAVLPCPLAHQTLSSQPFQQAVMLVVLASRLDLERQR